MKVMKFGGTSVGSASNIANVKKIVSRVEEPPLVVVVSAFKGITDKLLTTSQMAAAGDYSYEREFREIVEQHLTVVSKLDVTGEERNKLEIEVNKLLEELSNIFKGVFLINDLSPKTSDKIVSYGERLSSLIISYSFTDFELIDVAKLVQTDSAFGKHTPDIELSSKLIQAAFESSSKRILVAGFISTCKTTGGEITNLGGRGGSDYTAAIFAAALNANILEIWSDVDGFMSADPKVINGGAHVIEYLTFTEATELCNFGAKIIYPPTIFPVYHKNIPIRIKNTFKPEAPGTYISHDGGDPKKSKALIKGISSISDACLITVQGLGMVGIIGGVNFRIFRLGQKWYQCVPCLSGIVRKQYIHRCAFCGCGTGCSGTGGRIR